MNDKYKIISKLGEGAFGTCYSVSKNNTSGIARAAKFIKKEGMTAEEEQTLFHEVKILSEMDHPNIVRLYEFYNQ